MKKKPAWAWKIIKKIPTSLIRPHFKLFWAKKTQINHVKKMSTTTMTSFQTRTRHQPLENEEAKPEAPMVVVKKETPVLPECLLLMLCEPKLSLEVLKETGFPDGLRRRRRLPPQMAAGAVITVPSRRGSWSLSRSLLSQMSRRRRLRRTMVYTLQPARSSCSLPVAAASMAAVIEQKVGSTGPG
ncbi:hypothetical protein ACP275_11G096000 [Erythranthe tilingii]